MLLRLTLQGVSLQIFRLIIVLSWGLESANTKSKVINRWWDKKLGKWKKMAKYSILSTFLCTMNQNVRVMVMNL